MAYTPAPLQAGVVLGTSMAVVYTSGGSTLIKSGVAANIAAATTFSLEVTRSGGGTFVIIPPRSVGAGLTDLVPEVSGFILRAGDTISATAGAASSVNLFLNGLVF